MLRQKPHIWARSWSMLDVFHSGIPFAFCMVHCPPNTNLLFILPRWTAWVRDTTKILIHKSKQKRIRISYNGIMLLLQHADRLESLQPPLTGWNCVFSEHLNSPAWQMSLRHHFNSDFSSRLNFKIKTNLILNVPFIALMSSRSYQQKL